MTGAPEASARPISGFGDRADAVMQHADAHLVVADLFQRLNDRLGRTLHVGLDQHRQFGDVLVGLRLGQHLVQRDRGTGGGAFVASAWYAVIGDLARLRLGLDDVQDVAGPGVPFRPSTSTGTEGPASSTRSP